MIAKTEKEANTCQTLTNHHSVFYS